MNKIFDFDTRSGNYKELTGKVLTESGVGYNIIQKSEKGFAWTALSTSPNSSFLTNIDYWQNKACTMLMWHKPKKVLSGMFLCSGVSGGLSFGLDLYSYNYFRYVYNNGSVEIRQPMTVKYNQWNHLVVFFTYNSLTVFNNGIKSYQVYGLSLTTPTSILEIGNNASNAQSLKGMICKHQVYDNVPENMQAFVSKDYYDFQHSTPQNKPNYYK